MRNLVLLLTHGHKVTISLRDDDLNGNGGPTTFDLREFLTMLPAVVVGGNKPDDNIIMAYIEDTALPAIKPNGYELEPPNDFQRIGALSPGDAGVVTG
jgi:hypothetical protein